MMEMSTQTSIGCEEEKLTWTLIGPDPLTSQPVNIMTKRDPVDRQNQWSEVYDEEEDGKLKLRKRNPENWKQNVRKRNKNKGLEYMKANGEVCEKKKMGPPCTCKEKCFLKIGMEACHKVFYNFWRLGDHALQNAYIAGCVRIFLPKKCYKEEGVPSRRFFSRNFHVTVNGVDTEICKQAFLNLHSISNGRLDRLLKKKQEVGNTGIDERGRHSNKVNKIPAEKIKDVREHINGYRKRAGYTGRRKPKKAEVLCGNLNIRTMYKSYREETLARGMEPVCEYRYRKIFHADFHLDFGKALTAAVVVDDKKPAAKPVRKVEVFGDELNSGKKDPEMPLYEQLEQSSRELHSRVQDAAYTELSQVFKPDYITYTINQNWVYPNQI